MQGWLLHYGVQPCQKQLTFALQGKQTLGQYMTGDVLTKKEALFSWTGVAIMFFVVLVPTTNQTILAYFTSEVIAAAQSICKEG